VNVTVTWKEVVPVLMGYQAGRLEYKVNLAMREVGEMVLSVAKSYAPVGASGNLRDSHAVKRIPGGVAVGPSVLYSTFVHEGRNPGKWPPPGALVDWLKFKGVDLGEPGWRGTAYYHAEFNFARSIGRKGTKAQPWLKKALADARPRIPAIIARRLAAHG